MDSQIVDSLSKVLFGSVFSFTGMLIFVFELFIIYRFVKEIKLESLVKNRTPLVDFITTLLITSFVFQGINSFVSRYISVFTSVSAPLTRLLTIVEAIVFIVVLRKLYKGNTHKKP